MERAENKKKPWMKYRHRVVRDIAYAVMYPYTRLKYNIKIDKFKEQGNRPYLILMNHQTAFDQFFVGMAFRGPVYYVASEDLFSNGWISSLLRWLVAPIPIKSRPRTSEPSKTASASHGRAARSPSPRRATAHTAAAPAI